MFVIRGKTKPVRVGVTGLLVGIVCCVCAPTAIGHIFIFEFFRVGAYPPYQGSGWRGEAFQIPNADADHLLTAEAYVDKRQPDFTFRTPWIDFPAGPLDVDLDVNFETIGDFLNDYIYDVSDPSKLDEPFGHLLIRFSGFLSVKLEDDIQWPPAFGLPVWVEFGTMGHDGYRTRIVNSVYRQVITDPTNGFFGENAIIEGLGLFPIEVTYFNHYAEPENDRDHAGIELYSWHGGGLPWPAGENMIHPTRGPATIVPPRVIYQGDDILPLIKGDYDADFDVDLLDWGWHQFCFTGPDEENPNNAVILRLGCKSQDFDSDFDVELDDYIAFQDAYTGPGGNQGDGEE